MVPPDPQSEDHNRYMTHEDIEYTRSLEQRLANLESSLPSPGASGLRNWQHSARPISQYRQHWDYYPQDHYGVEPSLHYQEPSPPERPPSFYGRPPSTSVPFSRRYSQRPPWTHEDLQRYPIPPPPSGFSYIDAPFNNGDPVAVQPRSAKSDAQQTKAGADAASDNGDAEEATHAAKAPNGIPEEGAQEANLPMNAGSSAESRHEAVPLTSGGKGDAVLTNGDTSKGDAGEDKIINGVPVSDPDAANATQTSRIRNVTNKWNEDKEKWEEVEYTLDEESKPSAPETVATFRRHMDPDNDKKVDSETVEIHDQALQTLLHEIDSWWSDTVAGSHSSLVQSPLVFAYEWDKYVTACDPQKDDDSARVAARKDLHVLLQSLHRSKALGPYLRYRDAIKTQKRVKFEWLWTLFRHGTKVYAQSYMKELQMFEVESCSDPPLTNKRFRLSCIGTDWDGTKFIRYTYNFYIPAFSKEKPINQLEVFPTIYYGDGEGQGTDTVLRDTLKQRGRKYVSLCTGDTMSYQCHYSGKAIVSSAGLHRLSASRFGAMDDDSLPPYSNRQYMDWDDYRRLNVVPLEMNDKVIVDNYSFLRSERNPSRIDEMPPLGSRVPFYAADCTCDRCNQSSLMSWKPQFPSNHTLRDIGQSFMEDDERLLYLPPRLLGFGLKRKEWGQFFIDKLTPIEREDREQPEPWDNELQLDDDSKDLLMAFVKHHDSPPTRLPGLPMGPKDGKSLDIIEGKGNGLVIMFHGPPGVGKTLTAETIALATGRPLLSVSVAEIGTEADEAESKLSSVFADAARWQAVLLMDEADIFVEERTKGELKRNALVAMLLRCLEYYEGIIILTTNRVNQVDIAVHSRVHLTIQFANLTNEQRRAIYKNRLKALRDDVAEFDSLMEYLDSGKCPLLRATKLNGRQIRNIVSGARALAKSKGGKLSQSHLETLSKMTVEAVDQMKMATERQRARNEANYEL